MWHSLGKRLGGAREALTITTGPVFYDRTGKRLYYFIAGVAMIALIVAVLPVRVTPMAFDPLWTVPTNGDSGFPRRFLSTEEGRQVPILGNEDDEVLSRVVRVDRRQDRWNLVDPFTNETYRVADEDDMARIGDSDHAIDHYGRPPERSLMLTFDDGPDVQFTTAVLDILSREKVPATFFVLGSQVVLHPDVFRRIVREGHMAGNHTMFHVDFDDHTDFRNRQEIIATDRVMRATAGYASRLFRIPKGDPDNNTLALLQSQQLGYVQVDQDIDTLDWKVAADDELAVPQLDGRGHVVLLHDGGGDRSATIRMLEKFIAEAKSEGYTFSTLAPLLPDHLQPVSNTKPYPADTTTYRALRLAEEAPGTLLGFLFWLGMGSLTVMSLLYLVFALICQYKQNRVCWDDIDDEKLPIISVVLAAFNEEKVIARTIAELRRSDYPRSKFEVVAVNDGSRDDTLRILTDLARDWPRLRVVDQPNSGKSSAINNGINHAAPQSTVIVTMDADTLFRPDTVRNLVRHFARNTHGKRVGAVAGHIKVGNRRNVLTAWQSLEYISGICVTRMAERLLNAISIVPGACSAWSRTALEEIGGFCDDTMAEDCDATLALQRRGYRILQENNAIADTEAPETIRALAKQRKRWTYGNIQALWKHRAMLFRPRYGVLGMVALPYATLSLVVPLLFMPLTIIAAGMSIAAGNWQSIALYAGFVAALHMIISITAVAMAHERPWHLLVVPIYRIIYEPLRTYLLYASAYRALKGTIVAWDKLERRNSVSAFADRHHPVPMLGAQQ
ncbi:polysaccharide deacetylase [Mycobacterium sp. IS-1496]|uniref:bifunctional polysaccharide deacetylase/glycosyltransferase family 2 protein n=1 Tax=Mycobacterium sp. IS-1496 TaxID=1772284 RepID=UPI00074156E5|nr:bifunctional polysaccharide deacetylase/glycosyltransferase family 2 protein [Mycobacterium sp. IS-1496]KUI23136.1 polysaccharide deacetylase [Mycobacterium sp. IS-1496]